MLLGLSRKSEAATEIATVVLVVAVVAVAVVVVLAVVVVAVVVVVDVVVVHLQLSLWVQVLRRRRGWKTDAGEDEE